MLGGDNPPRDEQISLEAVSKLAKGVDGRVEV